MGWLRLLLAISVVFSHAGSIHGYSIVGGAVAVQCFYIISGFYIALILNEKYIDRNANHIFWINRGLRIYATYLVVLVFAALFNLLEWSRGDGIIPRWLQNSAKVTSLDAIYIVTSQITIVGQELTLFLGFADDRGLDWTANFTTSQPPLFTFMLIWPAWSLALELYFYAIAPFIARRGWKTIAAIVAASLVARGLGAWLNLTGDPWSYRFFPFEIGMFFAGVLSYHLYRRFDEILPFKVKAVVGYGLIALIVMFPLYGNVDNGPFFRADRIFLFPAVVIMLPALHAVTATSKLNRIVGDFSYPLYLCHVPTILLIRSFLPGWRGGSFTVALTLLSLVASFLLLKFIDIPLNAFRQALAKRAGARVG